MQGWSAVTLMEYQLPPGNKCNQVWRLCYADSSLFLQVNTMQSDQIDTNDTSSVTQTCAQQKNALPHKSYPKPQLSCTSQRRSLIENN